jgi:hypothetical protein
MEINYRMYDPYISNKNRKFNLLSNIFWKGIWKGDKIYSKKKVQIFHYYTITALGIFCKVGSNAPTMRNIHSAVVL